jgi:hypothetical protein
VSARASYIDRFRKTIRDDEAQISQNEASPDVGTPRTQPMDGFMPTVEYFETLPSDERIRPHIIHELDSDIMRPAQSLHRIRVDPISRVRPCPSEMIVWLGLIEIARIEAKPIGRS